MDILNELAEQADRPTRDQHGRAVRRMKRDRATINRMLKQRAWYEQKISALVNELRRRANVPTPQPHPSTTETP